MIKSVLYTPSSSLTLSKFEPSKSPLLQIGLIKIIATVLLYLPLTYSNEELFCCLTLPMVALEFWITKHLAKKYLRAYWEVDTSGQEDQWTYVAAMFAPATLEETFWYSFFIYALTSFVAICLLIAKSLLSQSCVALVAFVGNYIHFFAYSTIIRLRNQGVFNRIAEEVGCEVQEGRSVRLPLVHNSNLKNNFGMSNPLMNNFGIGNLNSP